MFLYFPLSSRSSDGRQAIHFELFFPQFRVEYAILSLMLCGYYWAFLAAVAHTHTWKVSNFIALFMALVIFRFALRRIYRLSINLSL